MKKITKYPSVGFSTRDFISIDKIGEFVVEKGSNNEERIPYRRIGSTFQVYREDKWQNIFVENGTYRQGKTEV